MSVFTKKLNPLTGTPEWVRQEADYDFNQEIARSAFADMLHDSERNDKYYAAIKAVIQQTHEAGKKAHVLDIGTGTGLLAMMAARCGADTIYACEAFSPISQCAEKVIRENGLSDRIKVVHKRSTDMCVGEDGDMPCRANVLVTEVFDTELIGEGAIDTFNHAHNHLLEKGCLVVPTSGTVYAQVIESSFLQRYNCLTPWNHIKTFKAISKCQGTAAVHDLQINQIKPSDFRAISPPQVVFRFDWATDTQIPEDGASEVVFNAATTGTADAIFMWWSLNMDPKGQIVLSCAPWWAHPSSPPGPKHLPWRDHWMQAIYYLPTSVPVIQDQQLTLASSHDEYSLWFNLSANYEPSQRHLTRPVCECMLHVTCSRTRIGMLNDPVRRAKYMRVIKKMVSPETVALSWGDVSLLGLLAATLGAKKVYHVEENAISWGVLDDLVRDNNLQDKITILSSANIDEKIRSSVNLVLGEPFFNNGLYPWDILRWWFLRQQTPFIPCVPIAAALYALPMQFDHLYKIRAPLKTISGFKMTHFDKLIEKSSSLSDSCMEVQPLWEYPGIALAEPTCLMTFDLKSSLPDAPVEVTGSMPFTTKGVCHGLCLWMDIHLDPETVVSTGPQEPPTTGGPVVWDPYTRQGVYFLPSSQLLSLPNELDYSLVFSPITGEITFHFIGNGSRTKAEVTAAFP